MSYRLKVLILARARDAAGGSKRIATRRGYPPAYKAPGDFLFPAPDGRGRDHGSTGRGIRRAVERAGLKDEGISAHSFRHTFASILIVA